MKGLLWGVIVFDDCGAVAGETKAIDEYFEEKEISIKKLLISHLPSYL